MVKKEEFSERTLEGFLAIPRPTLYWDFYHSHFDVKVSSIDFRDFFGGLIQATVRGTYDADGER